MNSRRQGFTLVEMLIVAVLGAVIMGAVYQTLTVEYRSNRQINAVVATQQTLRTSMQFLQSELREVGASAGDITYANSDSIRFRALRKVAFVCDTPGSGLLEAYRVGAPFDVNDSVVISASRDTTTIVDDTFYVGLINAAPSAASGCGTLTTGPWPSMSVQARRFNVSNSVVTGDVRIGDPIRSFETITYGLVSKSGSWVLGRKSGTDTMVALIGPLASPAQGGLVFTYYDTLNQLIPASSVASELNAIGRVQIKLTSRTRSNAGTFYSDTLLSDVFLRGN